MHPTPISWSAAHFCWKTARSSPEAIRKTPPIPQDYVRKEPLFSGLRPIIPTQKSKNYLSLAAQKMTSVPLLSHLAAAAGSLFWNMKPSKKKRSKSILQRQPERSSRQNPSGICYRSLLTALFYKF